MSSSSARLHYTAVAGENQQTKILGNRDFGAVSQPDPWPLGTPLHARYAAYIPDALRERGFRLAHVRPFATNGKRCDRRVSPQRAWSYQRLELNPGHATAVIVIDVDEPQMPWWRYWDRYRHGRDWDHAASEVDPAHRVQDEPEHLPPEPSWMVVDTLTGRFHVGYILEQPVHTGRGARAKPVRFLKGIQRGLTALWGGDPGYHSPLARNPVSPGPRCETMWGRRRPFTLTELAEHVPNERRRRWSSDGSYASLGRNCALYVWGMAYAERTGDGLGEIDSALQDQNSGSFVEDPLPASEVACIARSVDRRTNGRLAHRRPPTAEFRARQAERGRKSGQVRWDQGESQRDRIRELIAQGVSGKDIADIVGVSASTVSRVKRDRRYCKDSGPELHEPNQLIGGFAPVSGGVSVRGGGDDRGWSGVECGESTARNRGNSSLGSLRPGLWHDPEAVAADQFERRRQEALDPDQVQAQAQALADALRAQGRDGEAESVLDVWYRRAGRPRPGRGRGGDSDPP